MSKNFKKGFTLIELLVVIAIIGILAGIILVSLSTARDKGTDGVIKSELSAFRSEAELFYDDNGGFYSVGSGNDVCTPGGEYSKILIKLGEDRGGTLGADPVAGEVDCFADSVAWSASAMLVSEDKFWCVDSDGNSRKTAGPATGPTVCPPAVQ